MRRLTVLALAAMLFVLLSSVARAQRLDGTLRVTVTDHSQATIEEAKVTAENEATGVATTTSASSAGTYVFPNLLVGTYTVTVEKDGFKKSVQKDVVVESNQVAETKVQLELGSVSAVVEVEAGSEVVKTESSELGSTFSGRVANELPINTLGGDVKEFAVYAPGTTTQQGGVLGSGGSIGGTRPRFNGFSIDGVDDNRADVNGPIQPVIQDSVAEFTLLTNQFSAEYGHSAGGQFNIVTKSGTNNWHGEGHEYNQNRNYNAMDNLQKERGAKDRFDYNRAGASIGGPLVKNKLFIFGAYEFQNNGLAATSPTVTLPTADGLATLNTIAANDAVRGALAQFPAAPSATTNIDVTDGSGTVHHIPAGTFQSLAPIFSNQHDFIVNADLNLAKHQVRFRALYDRFRAPDFNASQPQPQFLGTNESDSRKYILTDAWTIAPSVINDFRASFSRLAGPNLVVPAAFTGFPNIEIDPQGINTGPDGLAPQGYTQNVYQLSDHITWVKGKHTLKFGVEYRDTIAPSLNLPRARGEWDYSDFTQFINDLVPQGANGALRNVGSGVFAGNFNSIYWFVQDDWKVTPRLVLNLGLRYEYAGVPRDEKLQRENSIADDPNFGIFFRAPKADTNNFAPRFGFAWDPTGRGKWSIRGGAGLAFDVIPSNFASNQPPPQVQFENNPVLTCQVAPATVWCSDFLAGNGGHGFLQGGGLSGFVAPTDQASARALTQGLNPDQISPKVFTWSLGVQHEILPNTSIELRYLGTHSMSLPVQTRLNTRSAFDPTVPGGGIAPLPTFFNESDVPAAIPNPASTELQFDNFFLNGLFGLPGGFQPLAQDGFFSVFTTFPASGQGIYHSGSVDVVHRLKRGLYFRTNYTFAKNIDNATNELFSSRVDPRRAQDSVDQAGERGRSALDINHKFTISFVYDLPNVSVSNAFAKGVLHGWEFSGTFIAQSGQPVTILSDNDSNVNGDSAGDRAILNPNGVGNTGTIVNAVCNDGPGGATRIVTIQPSGFIDCGSGNDANVVGFVAADPTSRYVQAGFGAKSNLGRNTFGSPGLNVWNMALLKTTKLNERLTVQFRAETYNTFNHRNFSIGLPTNNGNIDQVTNPNPLSSTYTFVDSGNLFLNSHQFNGGSRTMQLGLKLIF